MKNFPQNNDHKPGTWKGLQTDSRRSASFTCPECQQIAYLLNHRIGDDGKISPSVVCPTVGCGFHEFIKLEGWDGSTSVSRD